jgi:hypothetical protein
MRYFLISFDCQGLECLQDITEHHPDNWDKNQLMSVLMGRAYKQSPIHKQIWMMTMRARANTQRNYEIYIQEADDDITAEDFSQAFNANPQFWADFVRERHRVKIYSDRVRKGSRVIE